MEMNKTLDKMYDTLISYEIATEKELELVICINGYNEKTLQDVLYARTAFRNFEQLLEENEDELLK